MKQIALLGWLAVSFAAAAVGAIASRDASGFYLSLDRPDVARVRAWAGALLVPYLLWVSFATALTYSVWTRNFQLLGS